jgi:hypothetical protein
MSAPPAASERRDVDGSELRARRNRLAVTLTIVAAIWSLGLVIGALVLPVYDTSMPSTDGTTFITETPVAGYGAWVLIPVAVPLAVTGAVALILRRKRAGEDRRGGRVAWIAIGLLVVLGLVLILSIGGLVIPVALLLARALTLTSPEPARTLTSPQPART